MTVRIAKILAIGLIFWLFSFSVQASTEIIKIGVLAKRGPDVVQARWSALAQYLEKQIPQFEFVIVPLSFAALEPAVKAHQVDFLLTNSGMYSDLSFSYQLSSLATLKRSILGKSFINFGSVVLVTSDNTSINSYEELKGHDVAAVSEGSFGGWVAAYREMDSVGLSKNSLSSLEFVGTHDAVVIAVRDGVADAGVVRTDTLETMTAEGIIKMSDFKVLPIPAASQSSIENKYPLVLSSRLYPEWPFAKLPHVPDVLAEKISAALLIMSPDSEAAMTANIMGWTIPQNYREVDLAYSQLGLGAYKNLVNYSFMDVIARYWQYVLLGFFFITTLAGVTLYILSLNKALKLTQKN